MRSRLVRRRRWAQWSLPTTPKPGALVGIQLESRAGPRGWRRGGPATEIMETAGDWQGRSRRLFVIAAKAAAVVGVDVDSTNLGQRAARSVYMGKEQTDAQVGLAVPAQGRTSVSLRLRNWTGASRKWRAAADAPWIVPAKSEGELAGQEELLVTLDGKQLRGGQKVSGTLTIADVAGGRSVSVSISANVAKGLELLLPYAAMNVSADASDTLEAMLINRTASEQSWKLESSCPLVTAQPTSGRIAAGATLPVKLTAKLGAGSGESTKPPAVLAAMLTVSAGGQLKDDSALSVYVLPAYKEPAVPEGESAYLEQLPKSALKKHFSRGGPLKWAINDVNAPAIGGPLHDKWVLSIGGKAYKKAMWLVPHHETTYRIEGAGYGAFAADVGVNDGTRSSQWHQPGLKVCFEVHVDGQIRASSGLMGDSDGPRRLVADGLKDAKEIKLLTRMERLGDSPMNNSYPGYLGYVCNWADARFIKAP